MVILPFKKILFATVLNENANINIKTELFLNVFSLPLK